MRHGVRLGIDPGDARIGVARSDPSGLPRDPGRDRAPRQGRPGPDRARWSPRRRPSRSWSGCPARCPGGEGPAAAKVAGVRRPRSRGGSRRCRCGCVDERLTTVSAEAMLRDRGRKGSKRRAVVDQAAAVVILQHALDTERATGRAPGELVESGWMS